MAVIEYNGMDFIIYKEYVPQYKNHSSMYLSVQTW